MSAHTFPPSGVPNAPDASHPTAAMTSPVRVAGAVSPHSFGLASEARRPRLLIVDDERSVRMMLSSALEDSYDCSLASNGNEAVELIGRIDFDIVLTDIRMPVMGGMDLLVQVQRYSPSSAVIFMTASLDAQNTIDAMRLGAVDYILKPFTLEVVELCVERALRHRAALEENRRYKERLEALVVERTSSLQDENDQLEGALLEQALTHRATLSVLMASLETRDIAARDTNDRLVAYALRLGTVLGLTGEALHALEIGALLHDVGMIFVPETTLFKPGRLDTHELAIMRRHPVDGARLVRRIGLLAEASPIVEQHHERWDGTGYPHGLRGEAIDLGARIFAVADCIDAMTIDRPYSSARAFSEVASELLLGKETQFDPMVVDAFLDVSLDEWEAIRRRPTGRGVRVTGPLVAVA